MHQAFAEVVQPDAVHQHAGREGIAPIDNGAGQVEPAAAVLERFAVASGKHSKKLLGDGLTGIIGIAADKDASRIRFGGIFQDHGAGRRGRARGPPGFHRLAQFLQLGLRGTVR